uniref:MATH domain-containing protein n=1 Tax=Brassica oleracea var. oleracea TaxID=109376 RepID=A0A0D3BX25_BRAOL
MQLNLSEQTSEELYIFRDGLQWFNPWTIFDPCSPSEFFLPKFHDKDGGYIVNNCVKIVAEVDVLEKSDIQVEVEKINRPLRKIEENNGAVPSVLLKEASAVVESLDVNGFQVFPSQVESVRRIFERHPDISVGFRSKNQHLRNACMDSLLDVDWLEKNLEQVKEKKEKELSGLAMLQETEEKLLKQKQKCAEMEALANEMEAIVNEQKAELSVTRTPLSFDDVV